jgi:acyl carrier protein
LVLSTAHNLIVENDDAPLSLRRHPTRGEVISEICTQLDAFRSDDAQVIRGATVISKDLSIDSLAVMDMIMELEDRFDVSIPMNTVAEIHTVDELADTILKLAARR